MKKKIGIVIGILLALVVFAILIGQNPVVPIPDDVEAGKEYIHANEKQIARATSALVLNSLNELYPAGKKVLRDAHPYAHGCVHGSFDIKPDLARNLAIGVFAKPQSYPIWIRFSNGTTKNSPDKTGGIRGIGIKLMGVPGQKIQNDESLTQDFLLITNPVLPVGDPGEYLALFKAALAGKPLGYFFGSMPWNWKLRALGIVADIRAREIPSMLAIRYWSSVPFKLGDKAVKYSVTPCEHLQIKKPENPSDHYLREAMVEHLDTSDACFDFQIQIQKDPRAMPVEDPAIEWDENDSPFQKVATIRIPAQKFDSPAQNEFCENLTFNPWHSLPDHRPLGGINRVRKVVYDTIN